jgi:hypothetical protein
MGWTVFLLKKKIKRLRIKERRRRLLEIGKDWVEVLQMKSMIGKGRERKQTDRREPLASYL